MTSKVFAAAAFMFAVPFFISAQTPPPTAAKIIANVNISEATLLSTGADGILRIGFTITNNGTEDQSDIRLGIDIAKQADKSQTIVDSFVTDQTLALAPGESLKQEIQYPVPAYLSGEYEVWVVSKTTSGLMLGLGRAGKATFSNTPFAYVEIVPESCSLRVTGEDKSYTLYQGIDVTKDEVLSFSCIIINHSASALTVVPFFDTYRRSMYGEKVIVAYPAVPDITLAAKEQKTVSFVIPKATLPQSYDVSIVLKEKLSQKPISGKIIAHYVLQGASATIQNVSLDKLSYAKDDALSAQLFWTPSADSFPDSRAGQGTKISAVIVKMTVIDENGQICIDPISKTVNPEEAHITLQATAIAACTAPQTTISLLDEAGTVLDTRTFSSSQEKEVVEEAAAIPPVVSNSSFWDMKTLLVGIIVLLSLLGLALIARKMLAAKRNFPPSGGLKSLIFLVLISGGVLMGAGEAKGVSFAVTSWVWGITSTFTVNTDKSIYSPGETIVLSESVYFAVCSNYVYLLPYSFTSSLDDQTAVSSNIVIGGGFTVYDTSTLIAPTTPGNYNITTQGCQTFYDDPNAWSVYGWLQSQTYCGTATIPITVTGPTNGVCGAANGTPVSTAPTSGLCAPGSASAVSGSGPWTWVCNGYGGGTTASCSAPVFVPAPSVELEINGSNGPLNLTQGALKNIFWITSNATSCSASSSDGWFGGKSVPSGSESLTATTTSNHTLTCSGPGGSASDSVQVNVSCTPITGAYGACDCSTETKTRTNTSAACLPWTETVACDFAEKNSCRDYNWREVSP